MEKSIKTLKFIGFIPILFLLTWLVFVLRAWIVIGSIPSLDTQSPRELGFNFHYYLFIFMHIAVFSTLPYIHYIQHKLWRYKALKKNDIICISSYLIGLIVMFLYALYDPGNLLKWFFD